MVLSDVFVFSADINGILLSSFFAILILLIGIFLGMFVSYLIKRIVKGVDVDDKIRPSFIGLIAVVIKWSIYIGFFSVALKVLNIPVFTSVLTRMLITIPAFVGALILIGVGFAIAVYLRNVVADSKIDGWETLSQYLYYFVLYAFGTYAINLALVMFDQFVKNWIIVALTTIVVAALTYVIVKKELMKD